MKYSIFYLLKGGAERYNQRLIHKIGPKYGETYMVEQKLPPHITIKSSFETSDGGKLKNTLREFCENQKSANIIIDGFGNFRRFVAFLKVKLSPEAKRIQRELYKLLDRKNITKPRDHDLVFKPHATISYGNFKDTFTLIWDELNKMKKPKFELILDNLTLMKKSGKYWKVEKEFKLK